MEKNQPERPGTRKLQGAPLRPASGPAPAGPRPRPLQGGPGAAPRRPMGSRPPAPPPSGGGLKKALMLFIIVALGGIIAAGFIRKDPRGIPLWLSFLDRAGLLKATPAGKPAEAAELALKNALEICSLAKYSARAMAGAAEARIEFLDKAHAQKILAKLEEQQAKLPKALEEIKKTSEIVVKDASPELQEIIKKAGEELAKQQKITAELDAAVGRWKELVAKAPNEVAVKEPSEAAKPAERTIPKRPHPWGAFKAGAWTRTTTELKQGKVKQAPDTVTQGVVEKSLAEAGDSEVTLKVQTTPEGGTPTQAEEKNPVTQITGKILAEENVAGYDCYVVETETPAGAVHTWVPRRGRGKDLLTIKIESPAFSITATRVSEEIVQVGDRNLNVFKVESNGKEGDAEFLDWVTLCAAVPGFEMEHRRVSRTKTEQTEFIHKVVDFGLEKPGKGPEKPKEPEKPAVPDKPKEPPKKEETAKADPTKEEPAKPKEPAKPEAEKPKPEAEKPKPEPDKPKPEPEKPKEEPKKEDAAKPEPPREPEKPKVDPKKEEAPKAPEKKIDVQIKEADQLVIDGAVHFKQLAEAMKSLPQSTAQLKALSEKCQTAVAFFVKAKEIYSGIKENAPDPAHIDKKLGRLQLILDRLQKYQEEIKSRM